MGKSITYPFYFILLLLLHCTFSLKGQMQGIYTLGNSPGDSFSSLPQAISALVSNGVSGPVEILLANGIYQTNSSIPATSGIIPPVPGASLTNSITFKSASANPDSVKIVSAYNFIIKLDSCNFIRFQKISFESQSAGSVRRCVEIGGEANHIEFRGVIFRSGAISSESSNYALVFSGGDDDTSLVFDSCNFYNAAYGIYFQGNQGETGLIISNCLFENQYAGALRLENLKGAVILRNTVKTTSGNSEYCAFDLGYCSGNYKITHNKISFSSDGYAILLNRSSGQPGNNALIANNFIHVGGSTLAIGIFIESAKNIDIFNNNINVSSPTLASAGRAVNIQNNSATPTHIYLYNNILVNMGKGYCLCTFSTDTLFADYNSYTASFYFGYWFGYSSPQLSNWIAYTGQDAHSYLADPEFYSESDLHVAAAYLDSAGLSLANIVDDIDGEPRNAGFPDIGADEFTIYPNDAGITDLNPVLPCTGSPYPLSAIIKNFGKYNMTYLRVHWSVNGIYQGFTTFNGVLAPASATFVNLGNYNFLPSQDYTLKVWIDSLNHLADPNPKNDTLIISGIQTAMNGNYTIGNTGRDFHSFSEAVAALKTFGICGPVIFLADSGYYFEQLSIPQIKGASLVNTITFQSASGNAADVVLNYTSSQWYANFTLKSNTSNIRFNNMTISADGSVYGLPVDLRGSGSDIAMTGNIIKNTTTNNLSYDFSLVYLSEGSENDSLRVFDSNTFVNGSVALNVEGNSMSNRLKSLKVINNRFIDQYYISLRSFYTESPEIIGNEFFSAATYSSFAGISMNYSFNNTLIKSNKMNLPTGSVGIQLADIVSTNSSPARVYNNFLSIGKLNNNNCWGIRIVNNSTWLQVYYNNINLLSGNLGGSAFFIPSGLTNIDIKNNIFANNGGGYAIYCPGASAFISDYNNLYSSGYRLGYYNAGFRADLSAWRAASGKDMNSKSVEPSFFSDVDLHCFALDLDSAGTPIAGITSDIDNEIRNSARPDIGADEFIIYTYDAGVSAFPDFRHPSCDGLIQVRATITNYGKANLDSVNVRWWINGIQQTDIRFKGSLKYRENADVILGYFSFSADSIWIIAAKTILPNGYDDQHAKNDSFAQKDIHLINSPVITTFYGDTVCRGDTALLMASSSAPYLRWYDDSLNGKFRGFGPQQTLPQLVHSETLFVQAGSINKPDSMVTNFNGTMTNMTNGNMFDISALKSNIWIDSFDIHTQYSSLFTVMIYYRKGGYSGYESDPTAWTLLDSLQINSQGIGKSSKIAVKTLFIPRGETYGIYITTHQSAFLIYSPGGSVYGDSSLRIQSGIALDYPFDATFAGPATWNGRIFYTTGSYCLSPPQAVYAVVKPVPEVNLQNDTIVCNGRTILLDAGIGPDFKYLWKKTGLPDTLSTSRYLTVTSKGTYQVFVSDGCGNTDFDSVKINIAPIPHADFSVNSPGQCLKSNLFVFTNKSTINPGIMTYQWDFGDNTFSEIRDPQHSYSATDTFQIKLVATSNVGCRDTAYGSIIVHPNPLTAFSINDTVQCLRENSFSFFNLSQIDYGTLSHLWYFDDQDSTSRTHPEWRFHAPGWHSVKLIAISDKGCSDSLKRIVRIKENPEPFLGNDTTLCAWQHILLTPGWDYESYLWFNGKKDPIIRVDTNGLGLGVFPVWVKVSQNECYGYDTLIVTLMACPGINEPDRESLIITVTNPVDDILYFKIQGIIDQSCMATIKLIDIFGKMLYQDSLSITPEGSGLLDLSMFSKGIYVLNFHLYGKIITKIILLE